MGERLFSRRRFIAATGASLTAAGLATLTVGAQQNNDDSPSTAETEWEDIRKRTTNFNSKIGNILDTQSILSGPVNFFSSEQQSSLEGDHADSARTRQTPAPGPSQSPTAVAVGEGGIVLARDEGGSWKTVFDKGPTGNSNTLTSLSVYSFVQNNPVILESSQQQRFSRLRAGAWVVGENGAVGKYDAVKDVLHDHSKPNGLTHDFLHIVVTESPRGANVYIASKPGEIVYSFAGGESRTWNSTKISEAPMKAVDFHGPRSGHAIDSTQTVYATTDGTTWTPIGIPSATNTFYGVESRAPNDVTVAAGGGFIWRWNGYRWTPKHTGDDALRDVDRGYSGPNGLACGADGTIQRYDGAWKAEQTPTDETLLGVARATDYQSNNLDIAVGKQGTILEKKRPPKPPRFFNGSVS